MGPLNCTLAPQPSTPRDLGKANQCHVPSRDPYKRATGPHSLYLAMLGGRFSSTRTTELPPGPLTLLVNVVWVVLGRFRKSSE